MLIQGLQALPPDERLLEDRLLIQLAKVGLVELDLLSLSNFTHFSQEKKWRRCDCGVSGQN
jgi:hypothetical protein